MKLVDRLQSGELCVGSWIMMRDPASVEVLADSGLHWLAVDLEHAPISIETAVDHIRVGSSRGIDVLVRLPDHSATTMKRVLDAGASGVIVPDVRSVKQARDLLRLGLYAEQAGEDNPAVVSQARGVGLARAQGFGRTFDEYYASWNRDFVFIPQIEHIDAIPNARAIADLPGVSALFVGPYDLSASMGLPGKLDDPKVEAQIGLVVAACRDAGKPAGFHAVPPDPSITLAKIEDGVRFIAFSADIFMIRGCVDSFMEQLSAKAF